MKWLFFHCHQWGTPDQWGILHPPQISTEVPSNQPAPWMHTQRTCAGVSVVSKLTVNAQISSVSTMQSKVWTWRKIPTFQWFISTNTISINTKSELNSTSELKQTWSSFPRLCSPKMVAGGGASFQVPDSTRVQPSDSYLWLWVITIGIENSLFIGKDTFSGAFYCDPKSGINQSLCILWSEWSSSITVCKFISQPHMLHVISQWFCINLY